MMNKSDAITEIMTLNPTVGAAFLTEFSNADLLSYLQRLRSLVSPRGVSMPPATRHAEPVRSLLLSAVAAVPA